MLFKDIIGLEDIKSKLIQTVKDQRISHAQLFLGNEGCGNLSLAIAYAQYIACTNKSEDDSCGKCESCIKFEKLVHPDLHFVFPVATNKTIKKDPVSNNFLSEWRSLLLEKKGYISLPDWQDKIGTENKQLLIPKKESVEIIKTLSLRTYEAEYKTMIIWFPERFNIASANTLLKIFEEPPEKTLFMLVAYDSELIINTILSRTQLVKINRIEHTDLTQALVSKHGLTQENAANIATLSEGNYVLAKKLIDDADENFYNLFTSWMRMAFKADVISLIDFSNEMAKIGREKQKQFLNFSLHIFRESLIQNYGDDAIARASSKELQFLQKFAPFIHGHNCIPIIELFNEGIYHIERNANGKIVMLDISLKLTKLLRVKDPVQ